MRKYMWFLLAAAFVVAVFAIVGCKPAETPQPSPSPVTSPTPAPDTKCPQVVSTVVQTLYNPNVPSAADVGKIKIVITLNEPIFGDKSCVTNAAYWKVTVENTTRYDKDLTDTKDADDDVSVAVSSVSLSSDGKKITIVGTVTEGDVTDTNLFPYGLICDETSAKAYRAAIGDKVGIYATVADKVKVKLSSYCRVYDELGNTCCGLEAETCCSPVCEPYTPPTGCPL